jgi:citrate lyase beta subunit
MKGIRSLLFVPAQKRLLAKIGKSDADAYIIDIEDSISVSDKDEALQNTVDYLNSCRENNVFVRINRQRYLSEVKELQQFDIGFVLPKIETESDYAEAEEIFKHRKVIALIETPRALINADRIASIPWITALAFGAEDFSIAVNISSSINTLMVPKSLLVFAAKANKKKVFDTPCFHLNDEKLLKEEVDQAISLGFDGKLAIHPKQVAYINNTFGILDRKHIWHIINTYEASGKAVCEIDGKVYEKLHIDYLRRIIAEKH